MNLAIKVLKTKKNGAIKSTALLGCEDGASTRVSDCSGVFQKGVEPRNVNMENTDAGQSKAATKKENKKRRT